MQISCIRGDICLRCDWFQDGRNVLIKGKHYTPDFLFKVIENFRKIKQGIQVDNIYD